MPNLWGKGKTTLGAMHPATNISTTRAERQLYMSRRLPRVTGGSPEVQPRVIEAEGQVRTQREAFKSVMSNETKSLLL